LDYEVYFPRPKEREIEKMGVRERPRGVESKNKTTDPGAVVDGPRLLWGVAGVGFENQIGVEGRGVRV